MRDEKEKRIEEIWKQFKTDIIFKNRYFAGGEILVLLNKFKLIRMFSHDTKMDFYRARIGDHINKQDSYLLAPPKGKASAGRCNPEGISYLYLSSCQKTAVCEVRPGSGDLVSVAKINVDVSKIFSFRVHFQDPQFNIEIENPELRCLIRLIDNELSLKVTNRNKLNYLPLQYISEYIKTRGFEGFVYGSTVGSGMNLVMFNWDDKVKITGKSYVIINKVDYEF